MSGKKHNKGRALHLLRKQAWQFFKKYKVASNKSSILYAGSGKKRQKREVYPGLAPEDAKALVKVREMAYNYDQKFSVCGIRFGYTTIIGAFPVVGDFLEVFLCLKLIREANKVAGGLPTWIRFLMILNVIVDLLAGFVPILGDFVDMLFRANVRNAWMFDAFMWAKSQAIANGGVVKDPEDPNNKAKWIQMGEDLIGYAVHKIAPPKEPNYPEAARLGYQPAEPPASDGSAAPPRPQHPNRSHDSQVLGGRPSPGQSV
ncbi:hypothetical protein VTJ04DRAFT_240 [Mycothermus thermophilus]|uniref:uncharacterized protein n=1 Tax=Humicola insolens TaxID=85995 RepID=UPI003742858D